MELLVALLEKLPALRAQCVTRPELRAEYGIYAVDLEGGTLRYLFPGHDIVLSPNRELAAYTTSENGIDGFHAIRTWEVGRPSS